MKLVESMILSEGSMERALQTFGEKASVRAAAERPPVPMDAEQITTFLADKDPTPNKEYLFWLMGTYVRGGIQRLEDVGSKAVPALRKYQELKNRKQLPIEARDINRIKSLSDLMDLVDAQDVQTSKRSEKAGEEQALLQSKQAYIIYNDENVKVVMPTTEEASCYFGKNTRWCTAAREDNQFSYYANSGSLYIVLIKKENKRFQFQFEQNQFMDELDKPVNPRDIAAQYPALWNIFADISFEANSLALNSDATEEDQLEAVETDIHNIEYIEHPSDQIQREFVKYIERYIEISNNSAIDLIRQLRASSQETQDALLDISVYTFPAIRNPTDKTIKAALDRNASFIKDVKNPSEEIQMIAVCRSVDVVKYIANPSEAIQMRVIKHHGSSISYIKDPLESVQMAVVQRKPFDIYNIKKPTEQVQLTAVRGQPRCYTSIPNPFPSVTELFHELTKDGTR